MTYSYRLKNQLPVSVPRKLTPESVCLMQASQVSYDKLLKSGVRGILSFSSTQGTSCGGLKASGVGYLRVKENLKYIADFVKEQIKATESQITCSSREEISPEMCSLGFGWRGSLRRSLERDSYTRVQRVIGKEYQAFEFFVERIYRTAWNLTDQYISAIIEVGVGISTHVVAENTVEHVAVSLLREEGILRGLRRTVSFPSLQGNRHGKQ